MPVSLSSLDVVLFVASVAAFMAFHGWLFLTTSDTGSPARTEAEAADLLARLEAVQQAQRARSAAGDPLLDGGDHRDREVDP